jgi:hypothetical protein
MVPVSTTSEFLVADARAALRRRVSDDSRTAISKAFAAWLLHGTEAQTDAGFASLVSEAATREGAQQDFQTVAILGFGATAGLLVADQIEVLKKGLRRQAGRGVVIDGLPAAFCSDAVSILGIVLGAKAVADSEITDQVVKWISKFLKKSYDADRTELWERCLLAAADFQLGGLLNLSIPKSPGTADVRTALAARGVIEGSDGACDQDEQHTISAAMRELPDELSHDRVALRLAAVEFVVEAAMPVVGGNTPRPAKRTHSLSERDQRVHEAIGRENFCTLTNAEIMRDAKVKKLLRAEKLEPSSDAAKSCLNRIREANTYPMSREISQKRSSRN